MAKSATSRRRASGARTARAAPAQTCSGAKADAGTVGTWAGALAILALAIAAFHPAYGYDVGRHSGSVWDDDDHYLDDPLIAAPDGWWRIWLDPQPGLVGAEGGAAVWNYWPLTRSSFWVDRHLFGTDDTGRPDLRATHFVNVVLHGLNAALLYFVLAALAVPGALLAGLVYAVHPVTVESVAWMTERKNLLSTLFFLLALLGWLRFTVTGRPRAYGLTAGSFLLALMAKSSTVVFPVLLVLIHWWRREPLTNRRVLRLAPFFAMSLTAGVTSIVFERRYISPGEAWSTSFGERVAAAGQIVWFYLGKILYPVDVSFNYPRWAIDDGALVSYGPTLALVAVATALWMMRDRGARPIAFVLAAFVAGLFPVLGFFNLYGMRYAWVADHWQYLPCMAVIAGLAAAVAQASAWLVARWPSRERAVRAGLYGVSAGVVATLAALTWQQSGAYESAETLWRHTIATRPDSAIAYNNLGAHLRDAGRYDEATAQFRQAIAADPSFVEPYVNLGNLVNATTGRLAPAAPWWRQAIERDPEQPIALYNLALVAFEQGDLEQTEALLVRSLDAQPTFGLALEMLSRLYRHQGRAVELALYHERARAAASRRRSGGRDVVAQIWLAMGAALLACAAVGVYESRAGPAPQG